MTHTYAICRISRAAFDEIAAKLKKAGYDHAFMEGGEIDMHGIALASASAQAPGWRIAAQSSLMVLCAIRDAQSWHVNTLKDIDFAIEACRAALAAPPAEREAIERLTQWDGDGGPETKMAAPSPLRETGRPL